MDPLSRRRALIAGTGAVAAAALAACAEPEGPRHASTPSPGAVPGPAAPFGSPSGPESLPGEAITAVRGSRAGGWAGQTRAEVLARNGVVATSHPLAAQAGLRVLQDGGNSADAAIATAAVLGVVEPESAGIGGDSFAIHYDAKTRALYALNSAGWSPAVWGADFFRARGWDAKRGFPQHGIDTVTVPGAVEGWDQLLRRFGSRDFQSVLEPAIRIAEEGFAVTEFVHAQWRDAAGLLARDADAASVFLPGGKPPALYSVFRNPQLAAAYRLLQKSGRDGFYTGEIADAILRKSNQLGGALAPADLAEFRAEWVEPLRADYLGHTVCQLPPPNMGFGMLLTLAVLGQAKAVLGKDLAALGPRDPLFWHIVVEAKKLAYSELHRHNGDPRFATPPLDRLLSVDFARELCRRIDLGKATAPEVRGAARGGTVYLASADRWGNMTSFIYSVYMGFGSGVVVPGYGFPLQNRGALFDLDPASPNAVAGRKRPFHTLLPGFILKDGKPVLAFGNMGGDEQAQAQALEAVYMIALGYNPQAATDAARFHHDQLIDKLTLEPELDALVADALRRLGHDLTPPGSRDMGGYQAIAYQSERPGDWPASVDGRGPLNGVYRAASDHRKDGHAAGW